MTTPRDLMITALDVEPRRPLEQGELSLALAGAELIDLLAAREVGLDGDHVVRIVPDHRTTPADPLLNEAAAALVRREPYESVEDWLWRRGRGLSAAYLTALEAEGLVAAHRRGRTPFASGRLEPVDSPDRRRAADRRAADEPVLTSLAAAVGLRDEATGDAAEVPDEATETVLAAVRDAVVELAGVRQRRDIERAAFDNIWRAE
ncbi:GPP34 family phosphoprotein [Streptomyces sp. B6B3]|uniref:GOLPH3/VPS74 family protein n=1 Tax=Streptomyces sp. B6B3 TaxID=3153570 RepID=UPI00325E4950